MRSVVCIFFFVFFVVYRALAARRSPLGWPCWYVVRKEGGGTQFDAWFCTPFFPDDPFLLWLRHRRLHPALPPRLGRVHSGGAAGTQCVSHKNFIFLKKLLFFQLTCSFDYVTDSVSNKSFTAFFFAGCYGLPLIFVIFFYSQV